MIPTERLQFANPPEWQPRSRRKDDAARFGYVRMNTDHMLAGIALDLDRESEEGEPNENVLDLVDAAIPPNAIMVSPSGRCHAWWSIDPVYLPAQNGPRLATWAKAIWRSMTTTFNADASFSQYWVKNPAFTGWSHLEIDDRPRKLTALGEAFGTMSRSEFAPQLVRSIQESRECDLFVTLRNHALRLRHEYTGDITGWRQHILEVAREIAGAITAGHPKGDIRESAIRSTAKSVANYVWDHADYTRPNRGIMRLDPALTLRERQSKGAVFINGRRRAETAAAVAEARRLNPKVTQAETAQALKLSERTVRTYWNRQSGVSE